MTAIVGILNHRGVAFAADSAATHKSASGTKIANNANKIFALSKYHPVGIAIYNNLALMDVPWESIIKKYRISLGSKCYPTLKEYANGFWTFAKTYCVKQFPEVQKAYLEILVQQYYNEIKQVALNEVGGTITADNIDQFFKAFILKLEENKQDYQKEKAEDFKSYGIKDLDKYAKDIIDKTINEAIVVEKCPQEFRQKFCESLHSFVCHSSHKYLEGFYSGLVFFGYGDKDVFPSYYHYIVSYAIDDHIKYTLATEYKVKNAGAVRIAPFAQSDVTNTVIRAVEDGLRQKFYENYATSINGFRDDIVKQMTEANAPQEFIDIMTGLDMERHVKGYKKGMDDYIKQKYTDPLLETVSFLGKEDLSDLAESLVRMTCVKRHFSADEETVGGPVDVAVITQGDGFIWMKRKHYFDPDLNHQFFER